MDNDIIVLTETRPSRADAIKNRLLLLETARRLFENQGVDSVSMSAVAEAAGVGKGTLYRHFTNKTELCLGLLDSDQKALQENTLARLRTIRDPYENMRWFLREVVLFVESHAAWLHVGALATGVSTLEHEAHGWWRMTIRGLLQQMNFNGDLDYTADVLYMMVNINTINFQRHALHYSLERVIEGLWATVDRLLD
jgi:AcrR family transcriptional regulator